MRRRYFYLILLLSVALAIALWRNLVPQEPSYRGKTLRQWVVTMQWPHTNVTPECRAALEHIGAHSMPYLLQCLSYEPSPGRMKFIGNINHVLHWLRLSELRDPDIDLGGCVVYTFGILGTNAAYVAPDLIRILNAPNAEVSKARALSALGCIGPAGLPPILNVLTNQQDSFRDCAVMAVRHMGTHARPAIPALIQCLGDTNRFVVTFAIRALGDLRLEEDQVVPALQKTLRHPQRSIRRDAVQALGNYGPRARPAVPDLLPFLQDPDEWTRQTATNALRQIAPEAVPK